MKDSDVGTYSTLMWKGNKQFSGVRVKGNRAVLQGPKSDIKLYIPQNVDGYISGHVHIDPALFLHIIPDSECLVAPIVEYNHKSYQSHQHNIWFKIKIPHCIRKSSDLKTIKVRHGDMHLNLPFVELPTSTSFLMWMMNMSQYSPNISVSLFAHPVREYATLRPKPLSLVQSVPTVQTYHSSYQTVCRQSDVPDTGL